MKLHLSAEGELCRCSWCAPRLARFREALAASRLTADRRDYELMSQAQDYRAHNYRTLYVNDNACGGEQLYYGPDGIAPSAPAQPVRITDI